ncbi:BRO family protein [uncultured Treponema sp.]|uniref:BRO family protein n=1 Tax=uncultured Treponema sp. TaxID=162155 RepID=UPI0025F6604A|nr:BRO family protein [uncultured Treponema sp.]
MQNPISLSAENAVGLAQNDVMTFNSAEFGNVRTVVINGEPWFVGRDVALSLGYAKPENAISNHVENDDKTSTLIQGSGSNYKSKAIVINESGLYSLILGSKLESAKKFKHWVTSEVLPSIRKTGGYNVPKTYAEALQIAANQAKQIEEKNRQIAQMKPSADSWETYAGDMKQRSKEKSFRDVAKLLGLTPQKSLIKWFFDNGYIMRGGDGWTATQRGIESGMLVNRIITAQNGHAGEQCKVTTFGMMKLSYLKGEGTFDNCIAQERTFGERRKPRNYRSKSTLTD